MGDCGKHLLCKGYNARKTENLFPFQGEKHCSFIDEVGEGEKFTSFSLIPWCHLKYSFSKCNGSF